MSKYDGLSSEQLLHLLEKHDRTKKLGLVWERDEIEADAAIDANFIACEIVEDQSERPAPWDNLVIEGDNFDALRWLRMTHAGRVNASILTRRIIPAIRTGSIMTIISTKKTVTGNPHGWSFYFAV